MTVRLDARVRALLDDLTFVTLGTVNLDGSPHLSMMWVARDGDELLMSTVAGRRKERNLRRDPRASVLVRVEDNPYEYVEIRGRATLTTDGGHELNDALSQKYHGRPFPPEPADVVRVVIRVRAEHVVSFAG